MRPFRRGGKKNRLSMDLPCRKKSLGRARSSVKKFALSHGFGRDAEDMALATQEALKNIIQHAYPADNLMHFDCTADGDRMVIEVVDRGQGFDVEAARGEPASPMALHGRGIQLIRGLMDDVRIESGRDGTVVHMEKILRR